MPFLLAFLALWFGLSGGGGCGTSTPSGTFIPLACAGQPAPAGGGLSSDYFSAYCPDQPGPHGCPDIGHALSYDCEWNGLDDTGPNDIDSHDGIDPRWDLIHGVQPDGTLLSSVTLRDAGQNGETHVQLYSEVWGQFEPEPGRTYSVDLDWDGNAGLAWLLVMCDEPGPDHERTAEWRSDTGGPLPQWTAVDGDRCYVELVQVCSMQAQPEPGEVSCNSRAWVRRML